MSRPSLCMFDDHPLLRSMLTFAGVNATILVWNDRRVFAGGGLPATAFEQLSGMTTTDEVLEVISGLPRDPGLIFNPRLDVLLRELANDGARWLFVSERERVGQRIDELLDDPALQLARRFCRDDDCADKCSFVAVQDSGNPRRWLIYHLNRATGLMVPPAPLVAR